MSRRYASLPIERLIARARAHYVPTEELGQLAHSVAERVSARRVAREDDRRIAAHIALAELAAERLTPRAGHEPLIAHHAVDPGEPAERALAEHLHARLEPEMLLAVALRATCGVPERMAAEALHLTLGELRRVEELARRDAEALTLPYHDEFICEPADLAGLASSAAVTDAVRRHLARCRSCRREFAQRVWHVLGEAGALSLPLPQLSVPVPAGRERVRRALTRWRGASPRRLA
jgi:hypothetical protein